jgi:hypothetical protein
MAPYPNGSRDERVTVLSCRPRRGGDPVLVLWNYACHPVAFPERAGVASHFPHAARRRVRDRHGSAATPVLFLQGFSGDTRPSPTATTRGFTNRLKRLVRGPGFRDMTWPEYSAWSESLAEVLDRAMALASPRASSRLDSQRVSFDTHEFVVPEVASQVPSEVTFQSVHLAEGVVLIGVSAEVVSDYALRLRARLPHLDLLLGGCLDDPFGYAPTTPMLAEGGYEPRDHCKFFGLAGLRPDIEAAMWRGFDAVTPEPPGPVRVPGP